MISCNWLSTRLCMYTPTTLSGKCILWVVNAFKNLGSLYASSIVMGCRSIYHYIHIVYVVWFWQERETINYAWCGLGHCWSALRVILVRDFNTSCAKIGREAVVMLYPIHILYHFFNMHEICNKLHYINLSTYHRYLETANISNKIGAQFISQCVVH